MNDKRRTAGEIQLREFVEALADERRRYVLYYLRDEECAELEDVTEQVAAWVAEKPPEELDEQTRTNVEINLYHSQLPKLEETGIIEYDRRNGSVCFRDPPEPVEAFLDYCAFFELPDELG